jgi:hypothetical protein
MSVLELLRSQFRWGQTKTRRVMRAAELADSKKIGELTERQRRVLLERAEEVQS